MRDPNPQTPLRERKRRICPERYYVTMAPTRQKKTFIVFTYINERKERTLN